MAVGLSGYRTRILYRRVQYSAPEVVATTRTATAAPTPGRRVILIARQAVVATSTKIRGNNPVRTRTVGRSTPLIRLAAAKWASANQWYDRTPSALASGILSGTDRVASKATPRCHGRSTKYPAPLGGSRLNR